MASDSDDRLDRRVAAAKWLREAREQRGYTTAGSFARALGVERYQLSNWETGRSQVDDDTAAQVAVVLGLPEIDVRRGLGLWVPESTGRYTVEERPIRGAVGDTVARVVRDLEADTGDMTEEEAEAMLQAVLDRIQRQAEVALEEERWRVERQRRLRDGDDS